MSFEEKKTKSTPLRGKYLIQKKWPNRVLYLIDFILHLRLGPKKRVIPIEQPIKNILVCNLAHMGDVVLMTSLLNVLKHFFPKTRLGVLVGSWSQAVVQNHPLIDEIHLLDHWKLNRSSLSFKKKFLHYLRMRHSALLSVKSKNYDLAIDCNYYFPNAIPFLKACQIPIRIGYTSGGFGPLLTHPLQWRHLCQPVAYYYFPILELLNISKEAAQPWLKPTLAPVSNQIPSHIWQQLTFEHQEQFKRGYLLFHMGTSSVYKEWPIANWQKLTTKLSDQGLLILFTGLGLSEQKKAAEVVCNQKGALNLVDRISWDDYLKLLKGASLLIGVDSVAGHLAAALKTPAILIYSGINDPVQWRPMSDKNSLLISDIPCAPCFQNKGCASMACIQNITVEMVYNKVLILLEKYKGNKHYISS